MATEAKVATKFPGLKALRELEVRYRPTGLKVPAESLRSLSTPSAAANIFKAMTDRQPVESLVVAHLDGRHRPIAVQEVARGAGNVVHVSPRDVFAPVLATGASAIMISHNHPSGDATPSAEDEALTKRMQAGGTLLGIPVVDHLVIGEEDAYSFHSGQKMTGLWDRTKSYSTGGWGSALVAALLVGGLAVLAWPRKQARDGATVVGLDLLAV